MHIFNTVSEISIGDIIVAAKRTDTLTLVTKLSLPDHGSSQAEGDHAEDRVAILRTWRSRVNSTSFNHREALADMLYGMGQKKVALEILSGRFSWNKFIV